MAPVVQSRLRSAQAPFVQRNPSAVKAPVLCSHCSKNTSRCSPGPYGRDIFSPVQAPAVQTRPGVVQTPVLLTGPGAAIASVVQTRPGAAQVHMVQTFLDQHIGSCCPHTASAAETPVFFTRPVDQVQQIMPLKCRHVQLQISLLWCSHEFKKSSLLSNLVAVRKSVFIQHNHHSFRLYPGKNGPLGAPMQNGLKKGVSLQYLLSS